MHPARPAEPRKLVFVSVGSAVDMPGANTSILLVGTNRLLMDCGYAVPPKFCTRFPDPNFLDGVYLSHQHADHSFGLPALLAWMKAHGRTRPLTLVHGPGAKTWIRALLDIGYPGSFEPDVCFEIIWVEVSPEASWEWNKTQLRVAKSIHKATNWSLRIDEPGVSVAYSGDGAPSPETQLLFDGVTHLVHECSWATPLKSGHGNAETLLSAAGAWNVNTLYLIHVLSTHRTRISSQVASFQGHVSVKIPREGEVISLDE